MDAAAEMIAIRVKHAGAPVEIRHVERDAIVGVVRIIPRTSRWCDGYVTLRGGERIETIDTWAVLRQLYAPRPVTVPDEAVHAPAEASA